MAQFMDAGGGLGIGGKKEKTITTSRNASVDRLIAKPHFPSENLVSSKGRPFTRRQVMQPTETIYEVRSATEPMDRMILKAIALPILMQCRIQAIPH